MRLSPSAKATLAFFCTPNPSMLTTRPVPNVGCQMTMPGTILFGSAGASRERSISGRGAACACRMEIVGRWRTEGPVVECSLKLEGSFRNGT